MNQDILLAAKRLYDFMSACPPCPDRADVILALGSHDLRVPDHAAGLYLAGAAPIIICSGGYGKMTEGTFPKPEGVLFAERCIASGVPEGCVLIEDKATNTGENFSLSGRLAQAEKSKRALPSASPTWRSAPWPRDKSSGRKSNGASAFPPFPSSSTPPTKQR